MCNVYQKYAPLLTPTFDGVLHYPVTFLLQVTLYVPSQLLFVKIEFGID
jgi:hypothetical protein